MRLCATIQSVVLVVAFAACPLASQTQTDTAQDDLTKPFNWPMITAPEAGIRFFLRTRFEDGVLQYVVTLNDSKGMIGRWFSKHPDNGVVPITSFQVTFADEEGFHLYTLYLYDRAFAKLGGTTNWETKGDSQCSEKIYRTALKAVKASTSDQSPHGLTFPTELASTPTVRQQRKNQ